MPGMPNIPATIAFKNVKSNVIPKIPPIKLKIISNNMPEMLLIINLPKAFMENPKIPKNSIIRTTAIIIVTISIISPINIHFLHLSCHHYFDHYRYYNYYLFYFLHLNHLDNHCCHLNYHLNYHYSN